MKKAHLIGAALIASLGAGAPAYAQSAGQILKGTAIGAGAGALGGAIIPGVSTGDGALIGAAGGAAITALSKNRKYYRDGNGRRYYLDKRGRRNYRR
ncbi:hypothetical protein [Sphingomonas jatrophae]|uniref:Glycine zipper n=1 Tax=Sphingomonas jatrophae TaxID=1166337 RepID=A0A1I6JCT7_9SPHN|nr:hypothetical protein [Sphingomonas jatrophae]SFR76757.1 hypothetical protein SAMN05192580_0115 [Sphingomonas jatrophae]